MRFAIDRPRNLCLDSYIEKRKQMIEIVVAVAVVALAVVIGVVANIVADDIYK